MNRHYRAIVIAFLFAVFSISLISADQFPATAELTGDKVNLRAGNSTKYEVLGTLAIGTKLTVLKAEGEFYLIKCPPGVPAWIAEEYLAVSGTNGTVKGKNVNIRALPKTGTVIAQVSEPLQLKVISRKDGWVRIEAPASAKVYISKEFAKILPPVVETPKPTPTPDPNPTLRPTQAPPVKWEEKFKEAEKAFDTERAKNILDADFVTVKKLYEAIVSEPVASAFHDECRRKLIICDFSIKQQEAMRSLKDRNEDLEKRLRELQKELEEKLREIAEERARLEKEKEEEQWLATGMVDSMGVIINRPATHRLYKGDEIIYLLRSEKFNLDDYWGKFVGVRGTVSPPPEGWKHSIITVTEIKVLDDSRKKPTPKKK